MKRQKLTLKQKKEVGMEKPVEPGAPLNSGLAVLSEASIVEGVVTSDAIEAPPDMNAVVQQHTKIVEDVPKFREKIRAWLSFFVSYESPNADADSKAQVRARAQEGERFIQRSLFDNASVTTKRVAWQEVLCHKFQQTFVGLTKVAEYLAQLCQDGFLVELKAGAKSPIKVYQDLRWDIHERTLVGGYDVYYGFPQTSDADPEPILAPRSEGERAVIEAFKAMVSRAAAEARKRWTAETEGFLTKWRQDSMTPDQFAERQVGHCLFYLPSSMGTRKIGDGKGARMIPVFREGGYLVMQNKKEVKRGGEGEEVHAYVVAFLNEDDPKCVGRFERKLRACSIFRPPVYVDPAWARGNGCPHLEGPMGKVRWDIATTVQAAYKAWAGAGANTGAEESEGAQQEEPGNGEDHVETGK